MYSRIFFFFLSRTSSEVNCFDHSAPPRAMPLAQPSYLLSPFLSSFLSLFRYYCFISFTFTPPLFSFHLTHPVTDILDLANVCVNKILGKPPNLFARNCPQIRMGNKVSSPCVSMQSFKTFVLRLEEYRAYLHTWRYFSSCGMKFHDLTKRLCHMRMYLRCFYTYNCIFHFYCSIK